MGKMSWLFRFSVALLLTIAMPFIGPEICQSQASAQTVAFESGWENGQNIGFTNKVMYSKAVAGPVCARQAVQGTRGGSGGNQF
jgi:hypothetical protein